MTHGQARPAIDKQHPVGVVATQGDVVAGGIQHGVDADGNLGHDDGPVTVKGDGAAACQCGLQAAGSGIDTVGHRARGMGWLGRAGDNQKDAEQQHGQNEYQRSW